LLFVLSSHKTKTIKNVFWLHLTYFFSTLILACVDLRAIILELSAEANLEEAEEDLVAVAVAQFGPATSDPYRQELSHRASG
jgi:hypothetical protein